MYNTSTVLPSAFLSLFFFLSPFLFTSRPFLKTAGGIVLGSVAVSAVSAVSADVLPYISVAIKASFLETWHVQYMQKQYC